MLMEVSVMQIMKKIVSRPIGTTDPVSGFLRDPAEIFDSFISLPLFSIRVFIPYGRGAFRVLLSIQPILMGGIGEYVA